MTPRILALTLAVAGCDALLHRSVPEVEEGNRELAEGRAEEALQRYQEASEEVPASPALHYDLGLAHLAAGNHDDAIAALRQAAATPDRALRAKALRALGQAHAAAEDWEAAADAFKRALLLQPGDEDARNDYEVAWLKLHPPCAAREDAYEDNDRREEAKPPDPQVQGPLMACPGDSDWFAVQVPAGHSLFVTVRTETEDASLAVGLEDTAGAVLREARTADGEGVARLDLRRVEEGGAYLIGVWEEGVAEAAYTLEVAALPPCPDGDDGLEDNDVPADARPVEKGEQALRICPGDEDWFAVSVVEDKDLAVSIDYDPPRDVLSLTLLDGDGRAQVQASETGSGREQVVLEEPGAGSWLVRVRGASPRAGNVYRLQVSDEKPDQEGKDQQDQQDQQEDEQQDQQEQQDPRRQEQQRIEEVLDSLREEDGNLALERALQAAPERAPVKPW